MKQATQPLSSIIWQNDSGIIPPRSNISRILPNKVGDGRGPLAQFLFTIGSIALAVVPGVTECAKAAGE